MAKVLISIVTHGQKELVQDLVLTLDKYLHCAKNEIFIVVTENTHDICEIYSEKFPVHLINNIRPKGFGSNHNAAFERLDCDFFLIVNPDIILTQSVDLDRVLDDLLRREIAISSPIIVNTSGNREDNKRADLTILNLLRRKLFTNRHQEKFDWYAGMFLIVRSDIFRELCGFDTKFFMYVEDCDFSMRAHKINCKFGDANDFIVIHNAQRASRKSFKHFRWHMTSLLKYWITRPC